MTTLVAQPRIAGPRRPQWLVVTGWTATAHASIGLISLGAGVLLSALVLTVMSVWFSVDRSFVVTLSSIFIGIPFVVALSVARQHVAAFVPQGATRPAVVLGNLAAAPLAGLVWAGVGTALVAAEALVFRVAGWEHAFRDADGAAPWERGWWFLALICLVNVFGTALSGSLVGVLFYRFHGGGVLVAILLLVPCMVPVAATVALVSGYDLGGPAFDALLTFDRSPGLRAGVLAAVVAGSAVGLGLLLRNVPVRSTG
ncbi:hypothetical protein [Georgenia sp. Z1491]|uniref:hypothetical protein n=1 Tax=Georgenia sp. Z1491 TaxID=3416707 RepID=UPI003CFAC926